MLLLLLGPGPLPERGTPVFLTGTLLFSAKPSLRGTGECATAQRLPRASAGSCPGAARWYGVAVRPPLRKPGPLWGQQPRMSLGPCQSTWGSCGCPLALGTSRGAAPASLHPFARCGHWLCLHGAVRWQWCQHQQDLAGAMGAPGGLHTPWAPRGAGGAAWPQRCPQAAPTGTAAAPSPGPGADPAGRGEGAGQGLGWRPWPVAGSGSRSRLCRWPGAPGGSGQGWDGKGGARAGPGGIPRGR